MSFFLTLYQMSENLLLYFFIVLFLFMFLIFPLCREHFIVNYKRSCEMGSQEEKCKAGYPFAPAPNGACVTCN